jgi:uncharacterized RDD family membrane protein YckC
MAISPGRDVHSALRARWAGSERQPAPVHDAPGDDSVPSVRLWPPTRRADDGRQQTTATPVERMPVRRRPMPCPHCDAELERSLAAEPAPVCPHCALPLAPVQIAGLGRRVLGGVVDVAILAVTAGPLAWGLDRVLDPLDPLDSLNHGSRGLDLWSAPGRIEFALGLLASDFSSVLLRLGPLLVFVGLYFMFTISWSGRSLGQRLLSMRVVDRHGQAPSVGLVGLRTVAQLAGLVAAALGPLWIAIDSERRALHDLVAGTYVVRSA